jgi:hypothetical protein
MVRRLPSTAPVVAFLALSLALAPQPARAAGEWEITRDSEAALERGLTWLAATQGPEGNWESKDLGLVSMGALAFLASGHTPGHGRFGEPSARAINYVLKNAKPSGLLNIAESQHDMYNHGLSTFVLGQAYGMTDDPRLGPVLDRALKLIAFTQCEDGDWDYVARRQKHGHDLSLSVMQAKALRSAVDSGLEVSPEVIELALKSVREHYKVDSGKTNFDDPAVRAEAGRFWYTRTTGPASLALSACGVVCLQEFGAYDDWRIESAMRGIVPQVMRVKGSNHDGNLPLNAYELYYVAQAIYQVGGSAWNDGYPVVRDALVGAQHVDPKNPLEDGWWTDTQWVKGGKPGKLYGTAVGCFVLAIPNRYLPILQDGKIEGLKRLSAKE